MRIIHDELGKFQANGIEMCMTESAPSYFWPLSYILLSVGEARVHILLFPWLGVNKCLCFWGTHTTVSGRESVGKYVFCSMLRAVVGQKPVHPMK